MHPVGNIRGTLSRHLDGRTIVLAVCGSIGAVKAVELARELVRHGAEVVPVMSEAATRILHPDALEFATGRKPITRLTGQVEHVALLGDVPGRADALLIAPATANTVAKMALGIDDTTVTTCATVAFGNKVPVVVAPAMHEVMLGHPIVEEHRRTLVERLGVTWVEPLREERKAKLADVEAIAEAVIHRLANDPRRPGPLAGKRALVIGGATAEPIDPVRILTNRSSGRTALALATALRRLGATVEAWHGHGSHPVPGHLEPFVRRFDTVTDLLAMAKAGRLERFDQVWMPAAIGDYGMAPARQKIPSEAESLVLELEPLPKVIAAVRRLAPKATLVAFKAESDPATLVLRARDRLARYGADAVVANTSEAFGAAQATVHLVTDEGAERFAGPKQEVVAAVALAVARLPVRTTGRGASQAPGASPAKAGPATAAGDRVGKARMGSKGGKGADRARGSKRVARGGSIAAPKPGRSAR